MSGERGTLDAEIDARVLRELMSSWLVTNLRVFKSSMRSPVFELLDGEHHLGEWRRTHRTMAFSRSFVRRQPWGVVEEVLKHEMAHQYVHEVLQVLDESAHGPAFRQVCERFGVDPSASGMPKPRGEETEEDRVLRRVEKLLALAESPNANEAQAAANAARRLMLKYNIQALPSGHGFRHLGEVSARVMEADRWLASLLAEHFFVAVVWVPSFDVFTGKRGRVLEICGTEPNLEFASYVWGFLRETAARLWVQHKRTKRIFGDKDRQRFLAGVMRGFRDKLTEGARECREAGLVWVGDPRLNDYLHQRYPRLRHVRYGGNARTAAWEEGHAAGREIVLHKPVRGETGGGGKLLGG